MLATGIPKSLGLLSNKRLCAAKPLARSRLPVRHLVAASAATSEATASPAAPATARPAVDNSKTKVSLSKDSASQSGGDRGTLGALLGTLRNNPRHVAYIDVSIDDNSAIKRAARLMTQASLILAKEQPNQVVEVLVSKRSRSKPNKARPSGDGAGAKPAASESLRITGVLQPGKQVSANALKPGGADANADTQANTTLKVGTSTVPTKLAAALLGRLETFGEAKVAAMGTDSLAAALKAVAICRAKVNTVYDRNVSAYMSDDKLGDEAENAWGKITIITLRPSDKLPSTRPLPVANA